MKLSVCVWLLAVVNLKTTFVDLPYVFNQPVPGTALCSRSAASRRCSWKCWIALSIGRWCLKLSDFRLKNGAMVVSICKCLRKCFYIFFLFKQFFFSENIFQQIMWTQHTVCYIEWPNRWEHNFQLTFKRTPIEKICISFGR